MDSLGAYGLIIIFSLTIIVSYFFNVYAKKSGIPAVLMLITLGVFINFGLSMFGVDETSNLFPILKVLGIVGLVLIVLEAALDLHLERDKITLIIKSFLVALLGLGGTAFLIASCFDYFLEELGFLESLLFSIPLSILSSAIILPSIEDLDEDKREFMIYESTFSDILGIVAFYSVANMVGSTDNTGVYGELFVNLALTVIFSVLISYILIYVFQNIKGHVKLFLLIAILLLLYAVGKMFHLSNASLVIILIFGVILNNYKLFFKGGLMRLLNEEKVAGVLEDMKVVTAESAFVVRTFFFIIFGWSIYLGSLLNFKVLGLGLVVLVVIYLVRASMLFLFTGKNISPQLFLAPRGLITILLFFNIDEGLMPKTIGKVSGSDFFQGVLLFVILFSCIIMTRAMMVRKKNKDLLLNSEESSLPCLEDEAENEQE